LLLQLPLPLRQLHPLQHPQCGQRLTLQIDEDSPHFLRGKRKGRYLEFMEGEHPLLTVFLEKVRVIGRKETVEGQLAVRAEADVGHCFFLLGLHSWRGLL
jgi:hypothetical protein